jgi:REP element-mobilizing transposase RayT
VYSRVYIICGPCYVHCRHSLSVFGKFKGFDILSSYAWPIHYHIVFPVKHRKSLLDDEVVQTIRETSAGIEERYEIEMETIGVDRDHIHILCGAHPKLSPGRIVQIFKALLPGRYLHENPQSKSTTGVVSSGQTVTMWPLPEKELTGEQSKNMFRNKDYQSKISNSYRFLFFNTL